jgi:PP-loop superfamily ATP-utilizing enzyme
MKITKLKRLNELAPYEMEETRDAASKEELHEVLLAIDQYLNTIGKLKQSVITSLQDKMGKTEQMTLEFGAYSYEIKNEVKRKFNNDFDSIEDEAKFLEDMGFPSFVSRDEKTVNTIKVNRAQLKKAYEKNTLPESIASHYSIDEETNLKIEKPKEITKAEEE